MLMEYLECLSLEDGICSNSSLLASIFLVIIYINLLTV